MPSRSCAHEREELASAIGNDRRSLRNNGLLLPAAFAERQAAQVRTVEPQKVEGQIVGRPRVPEVIKLRPAGLVGDNYLAVVLLSVACITRLQLQSAAASFIAFRNSMAVIV